MQGNYERILGRISEASGVSKEEIERKIEAKRAKLSGLISKEGAAQVIASELGVNFDDQQLAIEELLPGMRKVKTVGQVLSISPVRTFTTKKGAESKVVNLLIADETSNVKVVLWDTGHVGLVENGKISEGTSVEISNGSMRDNELHLGSFSEIKPTDKTFDNVKKERVLRKKEISDLKVGESAAVRAFIVQAFEPRFFYVCPECNKKANQQSDGGFVCAEHGKVAAEKRAVANIVLDDGTKSIRAVLFHERIPELGMNLEAEDLTKEKEKILGQEMVFSGNVRNNSYFNNEEMIIDKVKPISVDAVIEGLEKK